MGRFTPNFGLFQPDPGDSVDLQADLNENLSKIDDALQRTPVSSDVNFLGPWNGSTVYHYADEVTYSGEAFVALDTNSGTTPVEGAHWTKLSARGPTGLQGPTGPTGPQGSTGATGSTGPAGPVSEAELASAVAAETVRADGVYVPRSETVVGIDLDGVPYFNANGVPLADVARVLQDIDNTPYFEEI